jgi:hypothetical protein
LTYVELAGITQIQTIPLPGKNGQLIAPPEVSTSDMENLIGRALQYYILRVIVDSVNPVSYFNLEPGKGSSVNTNSPVPVPDEKIYSKEKLLALIGTLPLQFNINYGEQDWMWKYGLRVPAGTKVNFHELVGTGKTIYTLRFERVPDLSLEFQIEPTLRNRGLSTFPKNFVPVVTEPIKDAYCYAFMIRTELQWHGDHSVGYEYVEWANGLESAIRKKLLIP